MSPVEYAAAFVLSTGLLAALVHTLAWGGYASVSAMRLGGWVLAALGILELSPWRLVGAKRFLCEQFSKASLAERCALVLSLVTVVGLCATALGPATDSDSLEYHLGVPLDWLRHGGAYPRPDWFFARLAGGLGESLNMLGLAAGTDALGATFQAAGLVVALVGVTAFTRTRADQLFAVLLVTACPVIVLLINLQKAQLLPAAALTVALVILVQRFTTFDLLTAVLSFGCVAFAIGCKLSFLFPGTVVVFIGLVAAVRAQRLRLALLTFTGCVAIFAVPIFIRNFVFYGDPISPFLERWRPDSDPAIIGFAEVLRDYSGRHTLGNLARLPWDLAVTFQPGNFHNVLGLGTLGFLLALRERGSTRQLLLAALAAFALIAVLGQLTPRFFLEPYLWSAAAAAAVPWRPLKAIFFKVLTVQAALMAVVAVYLVVVLFPGALTQAARERVMTVMAQGYAEAKWLDATLPPDAIVLAAWKYVALMPRPFVSGDRFLYSGERPLTSNEKQQLTAFVREKGVTVLVTPYPIPYPAYSWLATHYGTTLAGPAQFPFATRSPFNRGELRGVIATQLNVDGSGSQAEKSPLGKQ
jgi:hypothetical protein